MPTNSFDLEKFRCFIEPLIEEKPRSWIYVLKKSQWLSSINNIAEKYNTTLQGAVYVVLNNFNPICKHNKIMNFTWFANGFGYCGTRKNCKCNNENSLQKMTQTSLKKYGTKYPMQNEDMKQHSQEQIFKKHGVRHTSQIKETRDAAKQTSLARYGTEHPMQSEEIKNKCTSSNKKNHRGIFSAQDPDVRNKTRITLEKKYGVSNYNYSVMSEETKKILLDRTEFCSFVTDKTIQRIATNLRVDANTVNKYLKKYDAESLIKKSSSQLEYQIKDILEEYNVDFVQNSKSVIHPYELDFYLPDFGVAFELNGNYWHSELGGNKDKNYHYNKWLLCREKNISLYSWFEDEIENSIDVVNAKIKYLTKNIDKSIGARKCKLDTVSVADEQNFLDKTHLQKSQHSRQGTLGAYYDSNLVAIITWKHNKHYLEITRFATDISASYPGLFSKMLKHMIKTTGYSGDIVSFSNNGHSNGNLYKACGFKIDKILKPAYSYTRDYTVRENRQKYMKNKIAKRFNLSDSYIADKTEWELMKDLSYDRIWDSGKIKWKIHTGEIHDNKGI